MAVEVKPEVTQEALPSESVVFITPWDGPMEKLDHVPELDKNAQMFAFKVEDYLGNPDLSLNQIVPILENKNIRIGVGMGTPPTQPTLGVQISEDGLTLVLDGIKRLDSHLKIVVNLAEPVEVMPPGKPGSFLAMDEYLNHPDRSPGRPPMVLKNKSTRLEFTDGVGPQLINGKKGFHIPAHTDVVFQTSGGGLIVTPKGVKRLDSGDIVYMTPGLAHHNDSDDNPANRRVLIYTEEPLQVVPPPNNLPQAA